MNETKSNSTQRSDSQPASAHPIRIKKNHGARVNKGRSTLPELIKVAQRRKLQYTPPV